MRAAPSCADIIFEFLHQAGFANAGLATEQHHLARALLGLHPPFLQQPHFVIAANSGVKTDDRHLKAALRLTLPLTRYTARGVAIPLSVCGPKSWHSNKPCTKR